MKTVSVFLFFLLLLLSSCTGKKCESQIDPAAFTAEIRATLVALSDSLRLRGLPGWISFLDNSPEFIWVNMGSTVTYDSLIERLRYAKQYFRSSTMSWDSVWIQLVGQDEATVVARCTDSTELIHGPLVIEPRDITATLHRVNGLWKFHSTKTTKHDRWRGFQEVSFADTSRQLYHSIDSLVKASMGRDYRASNLMDVDDRTANGPYRVHQAKGYIFEDPHHQLQNSYIVILGREGHNRGSVAIVRDRKLVWRSKPLIRYMNWVSLKGIADVNGDGNTDIVISTTLDDRGYGEGLWIITPDSSGGRLLNRTDDIGESAIVGATWTFWFNRSSATSAYVIQADDFSGKSNRFFVYTWNGSAFVKTRSTKSLRHY